MTDSPEPDPESYARWLQARQPTLGADGLWFFRQSVLAQQQMADAGRVFTVDAMIEVAQAVHDPQGFEARMYAATDPDAEAVLVKQLAAKAVAELVGGEAAEIATPEPAMAGPATMSGITQRRQEAEQETKGVKAGQRLFLGRLPDGVRTIAGRYPDDSRTESGHQADGVQS